MSVPSDLFARAMVLEGSDRAELAHQQIWNFEPEGAASDPDHAAAWAAEIQARLHDLDEGRATLVPWEEGKARLRQPAAPNLGERWPYRWVRSR